MSHFSLIVALPGNTTDIDEELAERLAPYDEGREVEEYRDYESGEAKDFWWYKSIKRDAKEVAENDHSSIKEYKPDGIGISSAFSRKTPDEQWAEKVQDAEVFNSLPDPISWEPLIAAYNRYYCEGFPYSDGTPTLYDAEEDKPYSLTTYNPDSKWDYYRVGGRWGRYFPLKDGVTIGHPRLIHTDLSWEWRDVDLDDRPNPTHVEGGPKVLLDLEKLRQIKADETAQAYDEFWVFANQYPKATSWSELVDATDDIKDPAERRAAIERAREVFRAQPVVEAMNAHPKYGMRFFGDPLSDYSGDREDIIATARRDAVPGYALLTLEGQWMAAGEMGWFGMGSDNDDSTRVYKDAANNYIDDLSDDTILVALDLHI